MSKFKEGIGSGLLKVDGEITLKLWDRIREKGITRYRLSKMTGIRYDSICRYCNNSVELINKEYLRIFCNVLDCQISDLIGYNNQGEHS